MVVFYTIIFRILRLQWNLQQFADFVGVPDEQVLTPVCLQQELGDAHSCFRLAVEQDGR